MTNIKYDQIIGIETFWTKGLGFGGSIRTLPSDFEVREIWKDNLIVGRDSIIPMEPGGLYLHFTLEKRGIDTLQAIRLLSKLLKRPIDDFGYAGLKDGNAITFQRISLWKGKEKDFLEIINKASGIKIYSSSHARYGIKLGSHWGNQFKIIIRNISLRENNLKFRSKILIQELKEKGNLIPNYFGSQRFGGSRLITHLVGRHIVRREWKQAVMTYLATSCSREGPNILLEARKELLETENFKKFQNKLENVRRRLNIERIMTKQLIKRPNDWVGAIQKLHRKEISLFIGAYQSYLFNKCLSHLILEPSDISEIPPNIPLPGWKTCLDNFPFLERLLENDRISLADFKSENRRFSAKGALRNSFVKIIDFKINFIRDLANIYFSLPKGSYATVVLREIMKESFG